MKTKKKVLLIILDGYGEGKNYKYNAVIHAKTPFLDNLRKKYPTTILQCGGNDVGLPKGAMGGSEVGHFTIGAGRIVFQSFEEINRSIKNTEFFKMKELKKARDYCKKKNSKLHLLGMISDQGIHSHTDHLNALLKFAKDEKLKNVYIHAISDGRDVPERSVKNYIKAISAKTKALKVGKLASLVGRFFAMDRDKNWDRTKKAYDLITKGKGKKNTNAIKAVKAYYKESTESDYYMDPILLDKDGLIEKNDVVIFFNFRSDRAIQLTNALTEKTFPHFKREKGLLPKFICFGPYSKKLPVLFPPNKVKNNLGEIMATTGKKQLRIAETDKYGHVTFFFNSQKAEPNKNEKWILIPSPKVPSYAFAPEMSARKMTKRVIKELSEKQKPDFILLNFANCDLVGHSGNFEATIIGVETVDDCVAQIVPKAILEGYEIMITADHGNADSMRYDNGQECPSHSFSPVILMLVTKDGKNYKLKKGKTLGLKDIAPTVLELMDMKKPKEMTGKSLIK